MSQKITSKACVVNHKGAPFNLCDVLLEEIRPDEVLVEIKYTGICHTDLVVQQGGMPIGKYPAVLGHEGVGTVLQTGSNVFPAFLTKGDVVILSFRTCQKCRECLNGTKGACANMTEYNFLRSRRDSDASSPMSLHNGTSVHSQFFGQSSMSKMAVVDKQSCVRVGDGLSDQDLPFLTGLACGYLTGAGTVLNVLKPDTNSTMLILGMGAVGLTALLAAKYLGTKTIIAVDIVDQKLDLALSLGATHIINTKRELDMVTAVRGLCPDGVDYALDTTGLINVLESSVQSLAHRGVLALVGVPKPRTKITIDALDLLLTCKQIIGVIEGFSNPSALIPHLVQLYKDGDFPIDKLAKVYDVHNLEHAIDDLNTGKVVKPVISWCRVE